MSASSVTTASITIYIVEDSPLVLERLMEAIAEIPNARVVGWADSIADAFEGIQVQCPRVLLLDVQLRDGSGFALLKKLKAAGIVRPERVIVITNNPTEDYRHVSAAQGVDFFFDKKSEFERVRDVLIALP